MFTKMGVPNGQMALFTSLLYLPWTLKPLWSPIVDLYRTKRWWIIMMQILMSVSFVLLIFSIPRPSDEMIASVGVPISMFTMTLILFVITAFASATHDISADGFYMIIELRRIYHPVAEFERIPYARQAFIRIGGLISSQSENRHLHAIVKCNRFHIYLSDFLIILPVTKIIKNSDSSHRFTRALGGGTPFQGYPSHREAAGPFRSRSRGRLRRPRGLMRTRQCILMHIEDYLI